MECWNPGLRLGSLARSRIGPSACWGVGPGARASGLRGRFMWVPLPCKPGISLVGVGVDCVNRLEHGCSRHCMEAKRVSIITPASFRQFERRRKRPTLNSQHSMLHMYVEGKVKIRRILRHHASCLVRVLQETGDGGDISQGLDPCHQLACVLSSI